MPAPALSYLQTLATIAITFVGFASLIIILRQTLGGDMSQLDVLLTKTFIQLGFIVTAGALLPSLLALLPCSASSAWRISSLMVALPILIFAIAYPLRRHVASGVRTPGRVWLDVVVLVLSACALLVNALGGYPTLEAPVFSASVTAMLYVAGLAYLQALGILLRQHWASHHT